MLYASAEFRVLLFRYQNVEVRTHTLSLACISSFGRRFEGSQCSILGTSRSGFDGWLGRAVGPCIGDAPQTPRGQLIPRLQLTMMPQQPTNGTVAPRSFPSVAPGGVKRHKAKVNISQHNSFLSSSVVIFWIIIYCLHPDDVLFV